MGFLLLSYVLLFCIIIRPWFLPMFLIILEIFMVVGFVVILFVYDKNRMEVCEQPISRQYYSLSIACSTLFLLLSLFFLYSVVEIMIRIFQLKTRGENIADVDIQQFLTRRLKSLNFIINFNDLDIINPPIGYGGYGVVNKAKYKGKEFTNERSE